MTLTEIIFILTGTCVVLFFGGKLVFLVMMLAPKLCYPLPDSFFTSLGKWAVVTGGSDGIGRAYAQELSKHGMNVVIISRNQEKLDRAARKIVNNVGILPNQIPCKLLETADLEERIHAVINCNVKAMVKMCRIVLPGMQEKGRGVILNVSSGIAKIPCPIYTLYAASKVFGERFSQGLQAEYKSKGIIIQTVAPFGVSTSMTGYQNPDMVTFTAEEFVRSSLKYLKAGDQTCGSVTHTILSWIVQAIPIWVLQSEAFQHHFKEYVKERIKG
ncbi:17-beta-hydroxysteroid dehydrogenase type 3-like isoform X2 [Xyrauchen texanus]|uniref:17-beta-hydroxysteroid dehydrogenase type 3-like isoform X2 n=1 Tax=Xyrauchen texanus TaxID=154827 RepID=UPI002242635A|nr:17-beta-hydroxysteroid dehydrogenase type 3-like isoform X2 [Xyrauchen texanus]